MRRDEKQQMAGLSQAQVQVALASSVAILLLFYLITFQSCTRGHTRHVRHSQPLRPKLEPKTSPCTCSAKSVILANVIPKDQYDNVVSRRDKAFQEYKARTNSVLSTLRLASANSPLQYPTQGFIVRPLKATLIPGLALYPENRDSYKISLNVSKGILTLGVPTEGVRINGNGEMRLTVEAESLFILNDQLTKVSYTSTHYHINSVDLAYFQFENHIAEFPITIKERQIPVLYDIGTDINSQVTITTKTFLRYTELNKLLSSIRKFYSDIKVIIADDSFSPEPVKGVNIQHYIMPPGQGWFAGRNLVVSQVTTKYFLWVDDDFVFTEDTKIEKLVEVMEAVPELDVVGGSVKGSQFFFSFVYEEGDDDGGCLERRSNRRLSALPGQPKCSLVSGVVNFFLARTDAVQKVGFDPKLQRVAHSEFFMDGLGSLLIATCSHVKIGHQAQLKNKKYSAFRHPGKKDSNFKLRLHFFKNHLKCVRY